MPKHESNWTFWRVIGPFGKEIMQPTITVLLAIFPVQYSKQKWNIQDLDLRKSVQQKTFQVEKIGLVSPNK